MDALAELRAAFPGFFAAFAFIFGACIGSFLNVVILRLPRGETLGGRSHCACGQLIHWHDNIPILGWLLLRGRARCCGRPFSIRYPLVELATGLIYLGLWVMYPPLVALVLAVFASLMVVAAMVDLDTMEIPDTTSIGGFVLGLILAGAVPALHGQTGLFYLEGVLRGFAVALQGGLVASALIMWLGIISSALLRKETMGFGDVKLMGAIGAFCGWQGGVFALFGGALIGLGMLVIFRLVQRLLSKPEATAVPAVDPYLEAFTIAAQFPEEWDDEAAGGRVPFGPMLVVGALTYLMVRAPIDLFFADLIYLFAAQ